MIPSPIHFFRTPRNHGFLADNKHTYLGTNKYFGDEIISDLRIKKWFAQIAQVSNVGIYPQMNKT